MGFITCSPMVRNVIDSQCLRNIHQLALTCLVCSGVTHRRFELGVMELAIRAFRHTTREQIFCGLPGRVHGTIPDEGA